MSPTRPLTVVTPGDPAGIGAEILLKAVAARASANIVAVADPKLLEDAGQLLKSPPGVRKWQPGQEIIPGTIACVPVPLRVRAVPGRGDPKNAPYVLETLQRAVDLVLDRHARALVTGPVNKAVISASGAHFSGHTEFLSMVAGNAPVVMMLAAPGLRVSLVTTHLPLRAVADAIDVQRVEETIRITHRALVEQFGISQPRLQVLGLNPHAGESGHLGSEDQQRVQPAIDACRSDGLLVVGPVPADTAFTPPRMAQCDAVVAMYHDQGLPVLKHMGFGKSVNITLGLPFIRTSVDHGTAFDIAGSGSADCGSMQVALDTAEHMAQCARLPLAGR